jgi:hypothetical protein
MRSKLLTAALVAAGLLLTAQRASADLVLIGGENNPAPAVNNFGFASANSGGISGTPFLFFYPGQTNSAVAFLIVFNADGTISVYHDANVPVYDGTEDTLIGALNNSSSSVSSTHLTSSLTAFGFDGDGIDTYTHGSGTSNGSDTSDGGYGGPISFFTNIAANQMSGDVNFLGGLAPGASTYFSLEENLNGGTIIVGSAAPEPATVVLVVTGLGMCAGYRAVRRRKVAVA